jgi:hypothetical protein
MHENTELIWILFYTRFRWFCLPNFFYTSHEEGGCRAFVYWIWTKWHVCADSCKSLYVDIEKSLLFGIDKTTEISVCVRWKYCLGKPYRCSFYPCLPRWTSSLVCVNLMADTTDSVYTLRCRQITSLLFFVAFLDDFWELFKLLVGKYVISENVQKVIVFRKL